MIPTVYSACAQETDDQELRRMERVVEAMTGSIDLRGRVVDRDGNSLTDVTIKYFFREIQDPLSNTEIDYRRMTANGDFQIKKVDISAVHLTILKKGYYSETWSYGFHPDERKQGLQDFERIDVEIVLEKQPASAPLKKYEGILRTALGGPISVVEVKRQGSGETWLWKDGEKRELSWLHVKLAADEGDGGGLPAEEFWSKDHRFRKKGLRRGWIRFSDVVEGDGFIIFEPSRIHHWAETGMRSMTEAPEAGYMSDLEVSAEGSPETIYFYCKVNGNYGKGMVSGRPVIAVEEGLQVARAAILIYLNPTGSPNVSYIHQ